MSAIRRILVPVKDLQAAHLPSVLKSAQLARACGAELELFHCLASPLYDDIYSVRDQQVRLEDLEREQREQALQQLEGIAFRLRRHGIRVRVAAEWDFPAFEAIVRRAMRWRADLVVVGPHPGRHTAPWLLQLTDWELLRVCPVPVLLVKNEHPYRHPALLAAIDPSHAAAKPLRLDREILRIGREFTTALHGRLHAVHAYARLPVEGISPGGLTPLGWERLEHETGKAASARFERALRSTRIARTRRYLIPSDPADAILEAARRSRAAIVIMGVVSRTGLKRLLIGNTAERVLDALHCDLLIVKPPKFRNPVSRTLRGARIASSLPPGALGYY
jgi:universal stress protein E